MKNDQERKYIYKCANRYGVLTNYSKYFPNTTEAAKWYLKSGVKLEKMFDRDLILAKTYEFEDENS